MDKNFKNKEFDWSLIEVIECANNQSNKNQLMIKIKL